MNNNKKGCKRPENLDIEDSVSTLFENSISGGSSLLTADDLAKLFNTPIKTIYKWVSEKKIPYIKLGKLLRFDRALIQAWLSERSNHGD